MRKSPIKNINQKLTRENLYLLYIKQKKDSNEIAKIFGCHQSTVFKYMKKFKIKGRQLFGNGKNNPNFKNAKVKFECEHCHKEFFKYKTFIKKHNFCSSSCFYAYNKGENNSNFKNWKSLEDYPIGFTKALKELIRRRDNYTCQECGLSQKEGRRKLCVHHIDYNKENILPKNLISLCDRCHSRTNIGDRRKWMIKFQNRKIVQSKDLKDVLHDLKHIILALKAVKEENNRERFLPLCVFMLDICDKMYNDVKYMMELNS